MYTREEPPPGITRTLFDLGYTVVERAFSQSFPELVRELHPDVVIAALDPLQGEDQTIVRFLAAHLDGAVFIVLSVRSNDEALAAAMEAGADAALSITAKPSLVSAQVAALRRRMGIADAESRLVVGQLAIDVDRRSVSHMGRSIDLTRSEFDILTFLVRNAGRVLSPTEILAGIGQFPTSEAQARGMVKVHLSHLRQKLGAGPRGEYISTIRGVGYVFERAHRGSRGDDRPEEDGQVLAMA